MSDLPITDAERKVMEAVWVRSPLAAADIVSAVTLEEDWSPKTIQTLVGRLVNKGMLLRERQGRGYRYRPAISRDEFLREKSRGLVERLFQGQVTPLVAAFADSNALSEDDLRELRALVDDLESRICRNRDDECGD
ncbi:MAG: BlaI/MecI/CopY family transcriptional regulator [Candidatus Wenzhouxiangella sp. M2_3B_020]